MTPPRKPSVFKVGIRLIVSSVERIYPEQTIVELSDTPAGCTQMGRVDLPHLLWSLDSIVAGEPVNVVRVDEKTATDARLSLDRMIQIPRVTQ